METIVLQGLVSTILDSLISMARQEIIFYLNLPQDLDKLSSNFRSIQSVLADAEQKQSKEESVRNWLSELRDLAYDADDILDEWKTEATRSEIKKSSSSTSNTGFQVFNFLSSPCFCFNKFIFRGNMGHEIKVIQERLDGIHKQMSQFNFLPASVVASVQVMEERLTTSQVYEPEVFGREFDKERMVDLLLHESSQQEQEDKLSIISVVGMGGLGKTTLAQLAYKAVEEYFDIRMWVCVSNDFSLIRLTKAMIESAAKENPDFAELERGQECLKEILHGKRYLLVLDDMWNENGEIWDRLRVPLMFGAKGSRILVTTRKEKVARVMGTTYIHRIQGLSEEECWLLFHHKALYGRTEEDCLGFEEIGKEIVKKCKGLPLAIKIIGSVMHSKNTKQEWEKIRESEMWRLEDVEKGILPALMLSYQDLPPHLRQCFAYCSIFPKDYDIEIIKLIHMWMVQGYILPKQGEEMEELGRSYFHDLFWRSFFQDSKIDSYDGSILSCKMHDLISDLAQSISGKECSIIEVDKPIELPIIKARHSSFIATSEVKSIPNTFCKPNHLRTIKCIKQTDIYVVHQDLFHYSRSLRVLDLSKCSLEELPDSIGNLKHLRYLDLSKTEIVKLPESMTSLCNLMVLRLQCGKLKKLPTEMGKMISLRHLILNFDTLNYLPNGIGRIRSIRTLYFLAGDSSGSKIGELKNLDLLHSLHIYRLERVRNGDDTKEAALEEKKHIHTLELKWSFGARNVEECEMERQVDVLDGLRPHTNLIRLRVWDFNGNKFPGWIGDQVFSNLTHVFLRRCNEFQILPPLGQLPSLRTLALLGMKQVKSAGREFYGSGRVKGFPKLERLTLYELDELEEWDLRVEEGEMPCLLYLSISWCPGLKCLPPQLPFTLNELVIRVCPLLEERCQEGGEDRHKVVHIPKINIR